MADDKVPTERTPILDFLEKIAYLRVRAPLISNRLFPEGYPSGMYENSEEVYVFVGDDYISFLEESLARVMGLSPRSWSRYKYGTRPFNEKQLARLVTFLLYLAGERDKNIANSRHFFPALEVCSGDKRRFFELEHVPMRSNHPFPPSPAGLTRGSIFFARRWIAGSSPAMTSDECHRNAL